MNKSGEIVLALGIIIVLGAIALKVACTEIVKGMRAEQRAAVTNNVICTE
jgi:hypothetical protein